MQERTLESLFLKDKDYIFNGNLTITGDVCITNCSITVLGTLLFANKNAKISITNGNIIAKHLESSTNISIRNGDIRVASLKAKNIDSDSNIEVSKDAEASNIKCRNYSVSGDNDSSAITAVENVYIHKRNFSHAITAKDVFVGEDCDLCDSALIAKRFTCNGYIHDCSSMSIGV